MRFRTAVFCAVFALLILDSVCFAEPPIPAEVLEAWRANEEDRGSLAYSFTSNFGKEHLQWSVVFSPFGMFSEKQDNANGLKTRTVVNDKYAFQVTNKEGAYFLSRARRPDQPRADFENLLSADMELACPDRFPLGISLFDYANEDLFERINQTNAALTLNITLRCKPCEHEILKPGAIYTLSLDSQLKYRVREATVEMNGGSVVEQIDYEDVDQLGMMPVRLQIKSRDPGYPESKQDYRLAAPLRVSPSREEFFLDYYGIPETAIGLKRFSIFSSFGAAILFAVIGIVALFAWIKKVRTA